MIFIGIEDDKEAMFAKEIIFDENNIVCIEWPINEVIPKNAVKVKIEIIDEDKRKIIVDYGK